MRLKVAGIRAKKTDIGLQRFFGEKRTIKFEIVPKFVALPKSGRLAVIGKNLFENLDAAMI